MDTKIEKRSIGQVGQSSDNGNKGSETARIQPEAPKALMPVFETVWTLFDEAATTIPAQVPDSNWKKYSPVLEWNPTQVQPLAVIARATDDPEPGVFKGNLIGSRPALAIGPAFLTLTKPEDTFSALMLAFGDWVNLYGQVNRYERFTVDRNGYVRNRSIKKHAGFFEKDLGVDPVTGVAGRYQSAIIRVRKMSGKWERDQGSPYFANLVFEMCVEMGSMADRFEGLERFVPKGKGQRKPQSESDKRGWYCRCKTTGSEDAKPLTRFVAKGQWVYDLCAKCKTYVVPKTTKGTDTCTLMIGQKGQEYLKKVIDGAVSEADALANLATYDERAKDAKADKERHKQAESKLSDAMAKNPEATMKYLDRLEELLDSGDIELELEYEEEDAS